MLEMPVGEYSRLHSAMANDFGCRNLFVHAVLDRNQPGQVFVNSIEAPASGLVKQRGGYYFLFGDCSDKAFNRALIAHLRQPSHHTGFFELYTSNMDWFRLLESELQGSAVRLSRSHYILDGKAPTALNLQLPAGYRLLPVNRDLLRYYRLNLDKTHHLLWETENDYLERAFGHCLVADGDIACICNAFFLGGGFISPDILTMEGHRRKGLALAACSFFILKARQLGLSLYWDCDEDAESSNNLARRLGFSQLGNVPVLWWHENRAVMDYYLKSRC